MKELIPIKAECYSGYIADEYPKCFFIDNIKYEVSEVIDRWYQSDRDPEWPVSNYFKVEITSGEQYILKHDLESDKWYLLM